MPEGNALLTPNVSSYSNPAVNQLLAAGGGGANALDASTSNALQVANQAQQLQSGKVTIDQQTFNLAKAKLDAVHQLLGAVVANPSDDTFTTQLGIGVKAGTVDPQTAADLASHVASFGGNRQQIQQFALDGMNNNASHQEILQQAYGSPGLYNTGSSTVSTLSRTGPNAGTTLSGAPPIANTVTPAEKMAGITTKNSDGSSTFRPNSTVYDDKGNLLTGAGGGSTAEGSDYFSNLVRGGGGGTGAPAPMPPAAPVSRAPPPSSPQGGAPTTTPIPPAGQGQGPAGGASASAPQAGAGPSDSAGPAAVWTPGPQTMPVVTLEQAKAASARAQTPQGTAADRNLLRGYAVQNNIPLQGQSASTWEPQPGQAPQAAGQGSAPAASLGGDGSASPARQPPAPVQAPSTAQPLGAQPGQGGAAPSSGAAQGGGLTMSLSPGQEASLAAGSTGYAALSSDVSSPNGSNQRVFQLRTALGALRNTQTGLGTAQRQQLVGYLSSLPGGLAKWAPGVDPDSATSYDLATKYLNAYALNTPGAARSDAGLSTAQSANANTGGMMQGAAQEVTLANIGQELGKRALLNSFEKSGADPGTFNKFAAQWGQGVDPKAFALGDMTPAERSTLFSSLQGQQRANFLATIKKGLQANVISKSDLAGATGNGQ